MELSFEGLLITLIFLLPGFVVFYTRRRLQPARPTTSSKFELTLLSLGYSTVFFIFQAILFGITANEAGVDLNQVLEDPQRVAIEYPITVLLALAVWIVMAALLAFVVGVKDPFAWLLLKFRAGSPYREPDIWHSIVYLERKEHGNNGYVGTLVQLSSGDAYFGFLLEYETLPDENGDRCFVLDRVTSIPNGDGTPIYQSGHYFGDNSRAIFNTRDVDSLIFQFVPATSRGEKSSPVQ